MFFEGVSMGMNSLQGCTSNRPVLTSSDTDHFPAGLHGAMTTERNDQNEEHVSIRYWRSPDFRVIHMNGVYGAAVTDC